MNRRDFLKDAAALTMTAALAAGAVEAVTAQQKPAPQATPKLDDDDKVQGPPVNCAVIGLSYQGREILASLAKMGVGAPITMLCDTYAGPAEQDGRIVLIFNEIQTEDNVHQSVL